MGWGVVEQRGSMVSLVDAGVVRPPRDAPMAQRLHALAEALGAVIERTGPRESAVESVFTARNARAALVLGQARGAALVALAGAGLPVAEYTPAAIKRAVTGRGRADKHQVQQMIRVLLRLRDALPADASDAVAVALCHAHALRFAGRITRVLSSATARGSVP